MANGNNSAGRGWAAFGGFVLGAVSSMFIFNKPIRDKTIEKGRELTNNLKAWREKQKAAKVDDVKVDILD